MHYVNLSIKNYLFLFLLLSIKVSAQIFFDNPQIINKRSGLPTDNINAILKDDLGFMWFATGKGLCRWDGISIQTFVHKPNDSTSVSGNFIPRNAFVMDTVYKQIILSTENGLSLLDPHQLTFKNFSGHQQFTTDLSEIHAIFIDRQGFIWLGTNVGIVQFHRDGNSFKTYNYLGTFHEQFVELNPS